MSRVLFFPSSSSRASFSIARARLFALAIFFHPLFLFSLRFKVVIFSRPPFFQPVLRFVSLLIFFFGRSCAFVFEVQGLPLLLAYFLPTSSSYIQISSTSQTFPPDPFVTFLFSFIPVLPLFTFKSRSKNFTFSFLRILFYFLISFFLSWYSLYIQTFYIIISFPYYKFYVSFIFSFRLIFEWFRSPFHISLSLTPSTEKFVLFLLAASHLRPSSRRFLFEVSCPPGSAITSSYPVVWSPGGRVPFLVVVTNPFCAIHVQSSGRAIITKWTKREVLLTSSWHEPCGPLLAVSRKTCLHFYFFANVRR